MAALEDDQYNERHHSSIVFSSFRVPQRGISDWPLFPCLFSPASPHAPRLTLHAPRLTLHASPAGSGRAQTFPRWLLPSTDPRIDKDRTGPDLDERPVYFSMSPNRAIASGKSKFSMRRHRAKKPPGKRGVGQRNAIATRTPLTTEITEITEKIPGRSVRGIHSDPRSFDPLGQLADVGLILLGRVSLCVFFSP